MLLHLAVRIANPQACHHVASCVYPRSPSADLHQMQQHKVRMFVPRRYTEPSVSLTARRRACLRKASAAWQATEALSTLARAVPLSLIAWAGVQKRHRVSTVSLTGQGHHQGLQQLCDTTSILGRSAEQKKLPLSSGLRRPTFLLKLWVLGGKVRHTEKPSTYCFLSIPRPNQWNKMFVLLMLLEQFQKRDPFTL